MEIEIDLFAKVNKTDKQETCPVKKVRIARSKRTPSVVFKAKILKVIDTSSNFITANANYYSQNDSVGILVEIGKPYLEKPRTFSVPIVETESDMSTSLITNVSKVLDTTHNINENKEFKFKLKPNLPEVNETTTGDDILGSVSKARIYHAIRRSLLGQSKKLKERTLL